MIYVATLISRVLQISKLWQTQQPRFRTQPLTLDNNYKHQHFATCSINNRFTNDLCSSISNKDFNDLIYIKISDYINEEITKELIAEAFIE